MHNSKIAHRLKPIDVSGDDGFHLLSILWTNVVFVIQYTNMTKLPEIFRSILWSYDFEKCDPEKMKNTIIANAIAYGDFGHWRFIKSFYGASNVQKVLNNIPVSAVRPSAINLAKMMFGS